MKTTRNRQPMTGCLISNALASGLDSSDSIASSLTINHNAHAFNVLNQSGQRIASFLHQSRAVQFAKADGMPDEWLNKSPDELVAIAANRAEAECIYDALLDRQVVSQ